MCDIKLRRRLSKGNEVNIPQPRGGYLCGNTSEPGDVGGSPGKSFLFFLTVCLSNSAAPESDYQEMGLSGWQSTATFVVSGALPTTRENLGERIIFTSGRTHNRIRSPRLAASGQ